METASKIIVTGASGSVGREVTFAMASRGYHVVMACRNLSKGEEVRAELIARGAKPELLELRKVDVGSLASIREFAASFEGETIVKLFNNAGVINKDYALNKDGFERTVAVNYLGPWYLTKLLLPHIPADGEIVNMASLTTNLGSFDKEFFTTQKFSQLGTYSATKLALLLYSIKLGETIPQRVNVSDPGVVNSNMISMHRWFDPIADIFFRPFISSPEKGARSAVNALTSDLNLNYFKGRGSKPIAEKFINHPLKDWLWSETERLISKWEASQDAR